MSDATRFENRWRIEGTLRVVSPLHIGSGHTCDGPINPETDKPIEVNALARDHEDKPYVPASTLKGNLRAWLARRLPGTRAEVEQLFGSLDAGAENATGSKLLVNDSLCTEAAPTTGVVARVALDRATKTAIPQRLFHTEFVPAGVAFNIVIDGQNLSDDEVAVLLAALEGFNDQHDPVRLGGMAGHDWGRCKWESGPVSRIERDEVKAAVEKSRKAKQPLPIGFALCRPINVNAIRGEALKLFVSVEPSRWTPIRIALHFDGPFLVNDPSLCTTGENGRHHVPRLTADRRGLLPAESIRGALRSQAERIVRTFDETQAPKAKLEFRDHGKTWPLIELMFGDAGWASVFRITDGVTEQPATTVRQEFVAVDRFTGGVSGSSKYNAEYIASPTFTFTLSVDVKRLGKAGLGLLALTLRDLCEGDVPFGFGTRKGYGACRAEVEFSWLADYVEEFRKLMQVPATPTEMPTIGKVERVVPPPTITPVRPDAGEFHNPYHFVPVKKGTRSNDLSRADFELRKTAHVTHDRYLDATFSGRLVCKLTTEGPCVFGSTQARANPNDVSVVENYRLDGVHAVPATSIKGLLSAVAEAASNSALRVLHGERSFSYRAEMGESLGAIGMIVQLKDGTLKLAPLVLPQIVMSQPQNGRMQVPNHLWQIFRVHPSPLRVYLDGYQPNGNDRELIPNSFLSDATIHSQSHEHQEYWYLKLRGRVELDLQQVALRFNDVADIKIKYGRTDFLLGQHAADNDPRPIREADWKALPPKEQPLYRKGVLRVLGISERESDMPTGKKHELFLPVPNGATSTWHMLPDDIMPAVEDFYRLADERSESDRQKGRYPFELKGMARDANGCVRLRAGDLVCFNYLPQGNAGKIDRLAISSIWRKDAKTADHYFSALDPELLPFNPDRKTITLAEQLFGFVEMRDTKRKHGERKPGIEPGKGGNSVLALAGRLRVSAGRQPDGKNVPPMASVVLKILASPKPPSPALYFAGRTGTGGHLLKKDFADHKSDVPVPQGRKFYVHGRTDQFETANDNDNANQKNSVRPLPPRTEFYFHIDFDNLSETELALLCYAVRPTGNFRHKLGMGKPLGLGKVKLDPVGLFLVHRTARYGHDKLTDRRYHAGWVAEPPTTWPERYDLEKAAPATGGPSPIDLRELLRNDMDADIRHALELLGDPSATTAPVQYPNTTAGETEAFRWWVANDKRPNDRQSLAPITTEKHSLPTLRRQ